uniref:E3 ubiquitin-protein ligase UPL5-like n=1 Tax=Nicotiana tabacum TaxID=4097 RepID=A0A1S3WYU8_TOBAC|nr:PREDICTED: E3 ubiquitin-protein ligase UPL5-like [Nicotiana tabacum]
MRITGIPTADQRLIYKGKQLHSEQTLANCGIQKDESMQLVGRMRSTDHPQAWQLINDLVSLIFDILKSNYPSVPSDSDHIIRTLIQFLTMTPGDNIEKAYEHIKIFVSSWAPAALVMLYMSPDNANKFTADESVRSFVNSFTSMLPKHICVGCARIVLEFCKLLRRAAGLDDRLYNFCRNSLGAIVDSIGIARHTKELLALKDVFMFVCEVVVPELSHALELSKGSIESTGGLAVSIVRDFTEYMLALKKVIRSQILFGTSEAVCVRECIKYLHRILYDLLDKMELCLKKLEDQLGLKEIGKGKPIVPWWSQYLVILKELNSISKLFKGFGEGLLAEDEAKKGFTVFFDSGICKKI